MPKHILSMRAECLADVEAFFVEAAKRDLVVQPTVLRPIENPLPDIEIEFIFHGDDPAKVHGVFDSVEDSHVMRETLRQCSLSENSLERTCTP